MPDLPENAVQPASRAEWRAWLAVHHRRPDGVWLVLVKRGGGPINLTYAEAVEEALCFGWIDSLPRSLDAGRSMRYIAPRKRGSGWSAVNKARIERLTAAGLLHAAGQAKIDAAKRDGSWHKLDVVETLAVPPDLEHALKAEGAAWANFSAFPRSARRAILEWLGSAKKPETRAARITETAWLAAENKRANQWRGRT